MQDTLWPKIQKQIGIDCWRDYLLRIQVGIDVYQSKALFKGHGLQNLNFMKGTYKLQKMFQHMYSRAMVYWLDNASFWKLFCPYNSRSCQYTNVYRYKSRYFLINFHIPYEGVSRAVMCHRIPFSCGCPYSVFL